MKIALLVFILIIIAGNLAIWIFFMPWYVNRKIRTFQNTLIDNHYAEVETIYRTMRGWRHDYHNHIQVLKANLELKEYKEIGNYLEMLDHDLRAVDNVLKTGNIMVDAILNSKLSMMKERKIRANATAIVPSNVSISGIDLSVLIGNILDNAMEACLMIPEEEERFIRIYIDIVKKQLYIAVTNSMKGTANKNGKRYLTSKQGFHGFGLMRIDSIVSKYGGYCNRQSEQGVFATEVMLPIE